MPSCSIVDACSGSGGGWDAVDAPAEQLPACSGRTKKQCAKDGRWPDCVCPHYASTSGGGGGETPPVINNDNGSTSSATDNNHGGDDCERYHPTSLTERICTNSNIYPSLWNEPGMTSKYFFTSPFDCCDVFYDGVCDDVVDVCSTANDGGGGGDYTCAGRNKRQCRNEGRCTYAFDIDVCVRGGSSVYDDPGCGVWYASDASSSAW